MTIYLTVPGMKKQPVIVPDNATIADFCRQAFEVTGIRLFNGFGYKGYAGSSGNKIGYLVPTEARISVAGSSYPEGQHPAVGGTGAVYDATSSAFISETAGSGIDQAYSTLLSTIFTNGDEVQIFQVPVGG